MSILARPLPAPPAWVERAIPAVYAVFAVAFSLTIVVDAAVSETITLGPGLTDDGGDAWDKLLLQLAALSPSWLWAVTPLLCFVLAWNGVVLYRGHRHAGESLSAHQTVTFFAMNAVFALLLLLSLCMSGVASVAFGRSFAGGFEMVSAMGAVAQRVLVHVPTLVELPFPLPLLAAMLLVDLFHYWFHRLGHRSRLFWLLWHRPHHMTPYLSIPVTQPVFVAFPLFLLLSIPFQVGVGVAAKLFHPETMIAEALVVRLLGQIATIGSHTSASYDLFAKNRVLRALGWLFGEGVYHQVHHSALAEHSLVNVGAAPCMFWDRVFGTYVTPPPARPPLGLTGRPPLHTNPLRLALAGVLQLGYELRHNPGVRLRVIFGSSAFTPPASCDFALADKI